MIGDQGYTVEVIRFDVAKEFIHKHHYSGGSHNRPSPCFGLFRPDPMMWESQLIGCMMLATPISERVRASLFGEEHKDRVKELHRLAIIDDTPKNTESWFISRCLKMLRSVRPDLWGLISFADTTEGHEGTIYHASNALYCGTTGKETFYLDQTGRLRHKRQCGVNISVKEAKSRGWEPVVREAKHRFVFILGDKREKRERRRLLKVQVVER